MIERFVETFMSIVSGIAPQIAPTHPASRLGHWNMYFRDRTPNRMVILIPAEEPLLRIGRRIKHFLSGAARPSGAGARPALRQAASAAVRAKP
jgi:hypothetical protein